MKIVLLIIVLAAIGIIIWGIFSYLKWRNFKKYLKVGDVVDCYNALERETFIVIKLGDVYCTIEDEFGDLMKVQRTELYPNFRTSYKPKSFIE
jgi:ABC-type Na+ efflux pump permease subunit